MRSEQGSAQLIKIIIITLDLMLILDETINIHKIVSSDFTSRSAWEADTDYIGKHSQQNNYFTRIFGRIREIND